jgi:MFS family permease
VQGRIIRKDRVLWLAVLGNTYFWFLGALLTANIAFYGTDVLHITATRTGILQAAVAIGIGLGSLAAGYLSGGKVEYGLIPLGSVGMTVFGVLLSAHDLSFTHVLILLAALGASAGFFAVPVNALIQHRPDEKDKGGVIAAANLLSFVGIGGGSRRLLCVSSTTAISARPRFSCPLHLVTVGATVYVLYLLPDALLRLLLMDRDAHVVSNSPGRTRQRSRQRRSTDRSQPRLHGRCSPADRFDRPSRFAFSCSRVLTITRSGEAVRQDHGSNSNFLSASSREK